MWPRARLLGGDYPATIQEGQAFRRDLQLSDPMMMWIYFAGLQSRVVFGFCCRFDEPSD
jgi:hypothetical protein